MAGVITTVSGATYELASNIWSWDAGQRSFYAWPMLILGFLVPWAFLVIGVEYFTCDWQWDRQRLVSLGSRMLCWVAGMLLAVALGLCVLAVVTVCVVVMRELVQLQV